VVLISFDLDLKIYLNGFENKYKKRRKAYLLPAAWKPAQAGLPFPPSLMGRRTRARFPSSSPRPHGPTQAITAARALLSDLADGWDPLVSPAFFLLP
jgi:hypothetical protein